MQREIREIITALQSICGEENVIFDKKSIEQYSRDMADYEGLPAIVVRPSNELQISMIMSKANEYRLPVLVRGAGSSLTGAAVLANSLVLDMRSMNKILEIDDINWYARVQAGITIDELNSELEKHGFFFPPEPASSYICTIGGALAEDSGGLRTIRYGTMKDWVLSLRVVLANGKIVNVGEPFSKNRAGLDIVHLFVGSEGTLGIITEACLKIIPLPKIKKERLIVHLDSIEKMGVMISELRRRKVWPEMLEFLDSFNIRALNNMLGQNIEENEGILIIDIYEDEYENFQRVLDDLNIKKIIKAKDKEEAESFHNYRAMAYLAIKNSAPSVLVEDIVVPLDKLTELINNIRDIGEKYNLLIPVGGHVGDGNIHPTILYDRSDQKSREAAVNASEEICRLAISLGGSITGEHGIGSQKVKLLREQLVAHEAGELLAIMKELKRLFDPNDILNPGKYYEVA